MSQSLHRVSALTRSMGEIDMTVIFKRFLDRHMGLQGWSDMGHVQAEDTLTW